MKENLKLGLLGLVTVFTLVNTYLLVNGSSKSEVEEVASSKAAPSINSADNANGSLLNNPSLPAINPDAPLTSLKFDQENHDFGQVKQDSKNEFTFRFQNTGDNPLVISNAKGSCGCTVPDYPKEPVAPGEFATIDVVYSPGSQKGNQKKTVTVTANTEPNNTILTIAADVLVVEGAAEASHDGHGH